MSARRALERRVLSALDAVPRRIPFVLGNCGSGRTTLLQSLQRQRGSRGCQYVDVERSATTPERFYRALISTSPFRSADARTIKTPRDAFHAVLTFLTQARTDSGEPAAFLLDEALEFRTFESFPGLRGLVPDLFTAIAGCENRFVLTTRYARRAERLLRDPGPFLLVRMPSLTEGEIRDSLVATSSPHVSAQASIARGGYAAGRAETSEVRVADGGERAAHVEAAAADSAIGDTAHVVQALSDGRAAYVTDICEQMAAFAGDGGSDPISALTALLSPCGRLSTRCSYCYELRLHRARGYGALKAILDILALESPLTLTEIAQRLHRTPGSTKDYLSWLEDVDLVAMNRKRYAFSDPVLRLWVRLHCRPVPPREEEVAREVQRYALERLAQGAPAALQASA